MPTTSRKSTVKRTSVKRTKSPRHSTTAKRGAAATRGRRITSRVTTTSSGLRVTLGAPAAPTQSTKSVRTQSQQKRQLISASQPLRPSAHILDLKKLQHEQEIREFKENHYAHYIAQEADEFINTIATKLSKRTQRLYRQPHRRHIPTPQTIPVPQPQRTTQLYTVELEGPNFIKETLERQEQKVSQQTWRIPWIAMPQIRIPRIKIPHLSLPSLRLPRLTLPTFRFPRLALPTFNLGHLILTPTPYAQRTVVGFIIASFILTSPLLAYDYYHELTTTKGSVLGATHTAMNHVRNSQIPVAEQDFMTARAELQKAHEAFTQAQSELASLPPLVNLIVKALPDNSQYAIANDLLLIGSLSTGLATDVMTLLESTGDTTLAHRITELIALVHAKRNDIARLTATARNINPDALPENYRDQFAHIMAVLPIIQTAFDTIMENAEIILTLLGAEQPQRYLIVFQNNNEIRGTGGFIGSFAEVDVNKGIITKLTIPHGGSYDLRGGLKANIQPPYSISVLNERWEFQDANYFPDFPKTAEKLMWLYTKSGQSSVDGVIAINATFMQELLKITGPIYVEAYDIIINYDNFLDVAQYEAELGTDKEQNTPKRLIDALAPHILDRILNLKNISLTDLTTVVHEGLMTKEIQINLKNNEAQSFIENHLWGGRLLETEGDYLSLISTNIAGGKTDTYLKDIVDVNVSIKDNGEIVNTVTLTRTHTGKTKDPLSGVKHNDYLRFYVPLGSELLASEGFEPLPDEVFRTTSYTTDVDADLAIEESTKRIDASSRTDIFQDGNKTVFANWVQTDVGETQVVSITYKLPFRLATLDQRTRPTSLKELVINEFFTPQQSFEKYSLLLQRQSGRMNPTYSVKIITPLAQDYVWAYPSALHVERNIFTLTDYTLTKDMLIGIIFESRS